MGLSSTSCLTNEIATADSSHWLSRREAGEWVTKMTISSLTGDTHGNASRKIKGWIERLEKAGLLIPLETSKRDGRAWKMGFTVHRG